MNSLLYDAGTPSVCGDVLFVAMDGNHIIDLSNGDIDAVGQAFRTYAFDFLGHFRRTLSSMSRLWKEIRQRTYNNRKVFELAEHA